MRIVTSAVLLAALLPAAAQAQDACGALRILDTIQMIPLPVANVGEMSFHELIPVRINGVDKKFRWSTTGSFTQIRRATANELKLPTRQSPVRIENLETKQSTSEHALIKEFVIGNMRGRDQSVPIVEGIAIPYDGSVAMYQFEGMDIDMDFGSDKLNFFSPDHCLGGVQYWAAPTVDILPLGKDWYRTAIDVTLDGHQVRAVIATGGAGSSLRMDIAEHDFGLTMGSDDTPLSGNLLDDSSLKTYAHKFKSLSFGNVTVENPTIEIQPTGFVWANERTQLVGNRARTERDRVQFPELVIGMNVLRQLHIYFAFKEDRLYVSQASPAKAVAPTPGP